MVTSSPSVIASVQQAVASRRISATEAVQAAIDRIAERDKALNAVTALRAELALEEAAALDRRLGKGEHAGPLAGVPVLVKDLEDVAGMPTTMGSVLFKDAPPAERDGNVPARLRAAGAIVVGKANLPEFACEGYTANLLYGITRNPWALDWTPGGSSGGSGAAVAAGMVPIATATDGGGSIRIPAAFCGLVGLKPTNGLIARRPIPDWIDYSTDGPFATTVEDLRLLIDIESGPEPGDPTAPPRMETPPLPTRLRLIAAPRIEPGPPTSPALNATFEAALKSAEEVFGSPVGMIDPSVLWQEGSPGDDWAIVTATEHVGRLGRDFVKANLDKMHPSAQAFMGFGLTVSIDDYLAARRRRFALARALDELMGGDALLLTMTVAAEGFLADGRLTPEDEQWSLPAHVYNTNIPNMSGNPGLILPTGRSANGVPFGLQVIGPRFRDEWLLELAGRWETQKPWPRTAPGYDSFETAFGL